MDILRRLDFPLRQMAYVVRLVVISAVLGSVFSPKLCAAQIDLTIPTLPAGKSVTISYRAQINANLPGVTTAVRLQSAVSGNNFTPPSLPDLFTPVRLLTFILQSPTYFFWNGFLNMLNVVSVINDGQSLVNLRLTLFDPGGNQIGATAFDLAAKSQFDLLANLLPGFAVDQLGLIRLEFSSSELEASGVFYRFARDGENLEFAMGAALQNPLTDNSYVNFNTSQPSADPKQALNQVSNWLQLANLDPTTAKAFTVELFAQDGSSIRSLTVSIPPRGRRDIEAGHINPGINRVGLVRIFPIDPVAPYAAQLSRIGSNAVEISLAKRFSFASLIPAKNGVTGVEYASLSRGANGENYLVVSNTSPNPGQYQLDFFSNQGVLLRSTLLPLAGLAQVHTFIGGILPAQGSGVVRITPLSGSEYIAESAVYFRESSGAVSAAYSGSSHLPIGRTSRASYNRFLGQANFLKIFNTTTTPGVAVPVLTLFGASGPLGSSSLGFSALTGVDLGIEQLSYAPAANSYGQLTLENSRGGEIFADILRLQMSADGRKVQAAEILPLR